MTSLVLRALLHTWDWASAIRYRVDRLSESVGLAERKFADIHRSSSIKENMTLTRMLVSGDRHWVVTGTQSQIEKSSAKLARLTRRCVTVCVVVGHYHRRSCDEQPRGGYTPEGN